MPQLMTAGLPWPGAHDPPLPEEGTMAPSAGSHDSAEDSDHYVKDEDSSPSPKSDLALLFYSRPPSQSQAALARKRPRQPTKRAGMPTKSKSSVSSPDASEPPSSPKRITPRRAEDWEPWQSIIHELYIRQNHILKEVMVTMENKYNIRATPKMYKNQLARWGFFKYAIKPKPRSRAERDAAKVAARAAARAATTPRAADDMSLVTTSSRSPSRSTDGLVSPIFHESRQARAMQLGLTSVRDFLNRLVLVDQSARADMVVTGYLDPCFRFFTASMELLEQKEIMQGGLLLRRAFMQIESLVANMTVKGFSDLCFTIPHLLIECDRLDILRAYLGHLEGLARKFDNPPVREVADSLTKLLDNPEALMRFVMALTKANSDVIASQADALSLERTRKWAHNQYVACQRTNMRGGAAGEGKHNHRMLRVESQSVYWAQHVVMADAESDELAEVWMRRAFPDDFAPRTQALLDKVRMLGAKGILPPPYDTMMECLYIGWLSDYYEAVEDWPKAFEWVRKGLAISAGEQYQVWSIHVEGLMRKHGSPEEAEELRQKRLNHEFLETVRVEVEKLML